MIIFTPRRIAIAAVFFIFNNLSLGNCGPQKTAFLAFGDFGMGTATQTQVANTMVNYCKENNCDFVTLLGDNFYPNGVTSSNDPNWKVKFEEPYKELVMNFYPSLGNHDYFGNIEAQLEYSQINPKWKFPSRYYTFTECVVQFFVIDTEKFDEAQALWLSEAINLSTAKWKIVVGHRPIFSHGGHGDNEKLKETLLPLIKNKVDFYLSGHDHDLEYLVKDYDPEFVVSGAAAESRPVGTGKSTLFSESTEGFAYIKITPKEATVRFIDKNGELLFKHSKKSRKKL